MEPEIILKEAFTVLGVLAQVDADQPGFFDDMWMKHFMPVESLVRPYSADQAYYGVFFHSEDRAQAPDYLAGMAVQEIRDWEVEVMDRRDALAHAKLVLRHVPAAQYAVYRCTFKDLGQASDFILGQWLPAFPYEYNHPLPDFEYYPPEAATSDSPVLIYIPVKEKAAA